MAIGVNGFQAGTALSNWVASPLVDFVTETDPEVEFSIPNVNFADYAVIYVPSVAFWTDGGIANAQLAALNARAADIEVFLDFLGGGVVALTEGHPPEGGTSHDPYLWLHIAIGFHDLIVFQACPTPDLALIPGHTADCANQSGFTYHNGFDAQDPFFGMTVLARSQQYPEDKPLMVGRVDLTAELDCNENGTLDECDIAQEVSEDCNYNGIPDECDIADGTSQDSDPEDGVPDECDCEPCPTDADSSGDTGPFDLAFLLGNWGPVGPNSFCLDADDDGEIAPFDLAFLLGNWGPCPPP